MGFFKSLGQLLGGVVALVGQKAIIHSQTCDSSLTEAFHPAQLFSTAVNCTGKQPLVITNNESIITSFDAFNTSSHLNLTTHDGAESIVFDYPHNSNNIVVLPNAGYLPLLASATEVVWATFVEFYLEPACYTLLMTILLPLLLRIWRVVTPAKVYHERILPFILGVRRFIVATPKVCHERIPPFILGVRCFSVATAKVCHERILLFVLGVRCFIVATAKVYRQRILPFILDVGCFIVATAKVCHERIPLFIQGVRRFTVAISVYLERAYYYCALLIEVLLPFLLAAWQLITAPKPDKSPWPEASIPPIPSLPTEETTQLRLTTKSQATEIEHLKAQIAADKANKQKKIDDGVSTRVKHLEQNVKSWENVLAKEKADAGRSMERQRKYHDEELAEVKERFEADSKLTAEKNETIVADLKQRIDVLQAQVDGQRTQPEPNPQAKTHESVAIEAKDLEEIVAAAVQKKNETWESWYDTERTKAETKFKHLQGQLANATERSNSEKNRADQAESQFNSAEQIVNNERKRAEDAEQQLQIAQQNANQAGTKAQNIEIQLQNYQKHADEMWTTARKEAQETLNGYEKRANDAETKLKTAQKTAEEASYRAKSVEDSLKQLQDHRTYTGTSSASPLPSAALSNPTQATGPTDTPPKPSTAPLYNPTCLPSFGGGAAGTTRIIPTTSSIPTTSTSDLARYFTDKYNLPGPNGIMVPTIPGFNPIFTSTKLSGLPGPSNSSPPRIPGFNGPVFTPTNPTALPGKDPVQNPFDPNASPFNPFTRPGKGPAINNFNPNASPFKLDSTPPSHITSNMLSLASSDAMCVDGPNDLSNSSDAKNNVSEAVDGNKASAEVMAGRKTVKPRGRLARGFKKPAPL